MYEMTYHPVMYRWLTYLDYEGLDSDGRFPDENYGHEFMQLFTMGLRKLSADGILLIPRTR